MSGESKRTLVWALVTLALAAVVQDWIISGGQWTNWTSGNLRYSRMAEGFLQGQLNLAIVPPPQLLALPDPYDAEANGPYRLHDASLYRGKYYFYWGPVPGLIIAGACRLFGIAHPRVGDEVVVGVSLYGMTIVATILLFSIRARFFPAQPRGTAAAGVLSLAVGAPILCTLSNPDTYQAAIFAGQFFLLAGLTAAWFAMTSRRPRVWLLAIAGVLWALSVGSRVSLPPAVAVLAAFTLYCGWSSGVLRGRMAGATAALILPLAAAGVMLAWYDFARFGSIFETGASLQLAGREQTHPVETGFLSIWQIPPNAIAYLVTPPQFSWDFPYVLIVDAAPWLGRLMRLPPRNYGGATVGIVWSQPYLIFALAPLLVGRRRAAKGEVLSHRPLTMWLTLGVSVAALAAFCPVLAIGYRAERYLVDGIPLLTIAAAVGCWEFLERRPARAGTTFGWLRAMIFLQTVGGILIAVSQRPVVFERVAHWFPSI